MKKYRDLKKRVVSLIMAGMMIIGNLPVNALASEVPDETPVTDYSSSAGFGSDFKEKAEVRFSAPTGEEGAMEEFGDPVQVTVGESLGELPEAPEIEGFVFEKYVAPDESEFTAETPVTEDMTVKAAYTEQEKGELHGTSGALAVYVKNMYVALTDVPHGTAGRLQARKVDVGKDGRIVTRASDRVTVWTLITAKEGGDAYYVQSDTGAYLEVTDNGIYVTGEPVKVYVASGAGLQFQSESRKKAVNLKSNTASNGFQSYTANSEANEWFAVYPVEINTDIQVIFNEAGGTEKVEPISGKAGSTITLPGYSGTKSGYRFLGWTDVANLKKDSSYHAIYPAGSSYTIPENGKTFYAAWSSETPDKVQFGIRMDGTIPSEPSNYESTLYTPKHLYYDGGVIEQHWIVDVDSGKSVVGNCISNDVTANLLVLPSDAEIQSIYPQYDPETQYIHWYVLKWQGGTYWHVDGVVMNRTMVALTYDQNAPEGYVQTLPLGYQVTPGTDVTIGADGKPGGKIKTPARAGYHFAGWNTRKDGSGRSWNTGDVLTLQENVTLYAIWTKGTNFMTVSKTNDEGERLVGAHFMMEELTDSGFVQKFSSVTNSHGEFTYDNMENDTLYRLTETYAPNGYDVQNAFCFKVTVSDTNDAILGLTVCDENGNPVDAPDWLSIVYIPADNSASGGVAHISFNIKDERIERSITLRVIDENGNPISGRSFYLTDVNGNSVNGVLQGSSDNDGVFSAYGATLPYGTFILRNQEDPDEFAENTVQFSLNDYNSPDDNGLSILSGNASASCSSSSGSVGGLTITSYDYDLTVVLERQLFTVTWLDEDGTVLKKDTDVLYGTVPEYTGEEPSKERTDEFSYTFTGWDPEIKAVTADAEYTAVYESTINTYQVTYRKGDHGSLAGEDEEGNVSFEREYGSAMPGAPEVTAAEGFYFTGWDLEAPEAVTGDIVFTAQYAPKKEITLVSVSGEAVYNGSEQTITGFEAETFELDGNTYVVKGLSAEGSGKDAGTYINRISGNASVKNASGEDVTVQFTVHTQEGRLVIQPRSVELSSDTDTKTYDGSALVRPEVKISGAGFVAGEVLQIEATGTITEAGSTENTIVFQKGEGYKDSNYEIRTNPGTLTVEKAAMMVVVTGDQKEAVYDGEAHTAEGYTLASSSPLFEEGKVVYTGTSASVTRTEAGTYSMGLTASDFRYDNNSINVVFEVTDGSLSITPGAMQIAAVNYSGMYDGQAHYGGLETSVQASLPAGTTLQYSVDGGKTWSDRIPSIIDAGTITYQIKAENPNYDPVTAEGTLTVTKRSVALTSGSASKVYDGQPLTTKTVTVGGDGFAENEGVASYDVTGSQIEAGASENTFTYTLTNRTNPANYDISVVFGTLTVTADNSAITIESGSHTWVYDGNAHTWPEYAVTYHGKEVSRSSGEHGYAVFVLPTGDTLTVYQPASVTNVSQTGSGNNTFRYALSHPENYTGLITCTCGSLSIEKRLVQFGGITESREYTGELISISGTEVLNNGDSQGLVASHSVRNLLYRASGIEAGVYEGEITEAEDIQILANGNDVTANYDIRVQKGSLTIQRKKEGLEVFMEGAGFVFDGKEHALSISGVSDTAITGKTTYEFQREGDSEWTYDLSSLTSVNAGSTEIRVRATNPNYEGEAVASAVLTIEPKPVTVRAVDNGKVYGDEDPELSAIVDGVLPGDSIVWSVDRNPGEDAGTYRILPSAESLQGNYQVSCEEAVFTISKARLTLEASGFSGLYDGRSHSASVHVSDTEGTTLTYVLLSADGEAVEEAVPSAELPERTDAGSVVFKVIAENRNYTTASATASIVIEPRQVILTSTSAEKFYDGTALTDDTVTVSGDGFAEGEGASYTVSGTQTLAGSSENTFDYELDPETTSGENYRITKVNGTLIVKDREEKYTILLTPNAGEAEYDGTQHSVSGFVSTVFSFDGNEYTVTGMEAGASAADCGTYPVEVTGTPVVLDKDGNDVTAQFALNVMPASLVITPRPVTVTADPTEKTYGDEDPALTAVVEGLLGDDTIDYSLIREEGENAGTYGITAAGKQLQGNYRVEYRNASFVIHKKAVEVTADDKTKVYGEEDPGFTFTARGLVDQTEISCSFRREEGENAGSYAIHVSGPAELDNYTVAYHAGSLTILPKEVTVIPDAAGKVYGEEDPALTAHVEGLLKGDEETLISYTLAREEGEDAGDYDITAAGEKLQGNYIVTFGTGLFTIRRRPVTVTALPKTKVYGDADPELEAETEGLVARDEGTLIAYTLSREEGENAGSYAIIPSGEKEQGNYEVTFINSHLVITTAVVTVRAIDKDKTYGDADPVLTAEVSGMKNGENPEELIHYLLTRDKGEDAGVYTIRPEGDAQQGNYTVVYENGVLTIGKAPLTVKAENAGKVYGDEDPSSYTITLQGLRNGDDESIAECTAFRTSGEHAGEYVLTPAVVNEETLVNYEITKENGVFTIAKAPLTVTPDDKSKVYSEPDPVLTASVSGLRNGDTEAVLNDLYVLGREEGENAGTYRIFAEAAGEAADYDITYAAGTLTILPVSEENGAADVVVVITGNRASAVYDGEPHMVTGYTVSISSPLYTENDFAFLGEAPEASRTEVGRTWMGLSAEQFRNTNPNFGKVIFDIIDGYQDITGAHAVVTITGHTSAYEYDGKEHSVSGYDVEIDNSLYTADDFRFEGTAKASRTDAGRSLMGLGNGQFVNTNPNFTEVKFNVTDGYVDVEPIRAEVTIKGNTDSVVYDGTEHVTAGYSFHADTDLYTEADFEFTGVGKAAGTDAGIYAMGLTEEQFANTSPNFSQVTFLVEDGSQEITKRQVLLTSASGEKEYDGLALTARDVTVSGDGFVRGEGAVYTVSGTQTLPGTSENTFAYVLDAATTKAENYDITTVNGTLTVTDRSDKFPLVLEPVSAESVYNGEEQSVSGFVSNVFTINGRKYTVTEMEAGVSASDSGSWPVAVSGTPKVLDEDGNDVSAQFDVTVKEASLEIAPKLVIVTAIPAEKTYGEEDPALEADVNGLLGEDEIVYSLSREEGGNAGEYAILASGEEYQGNYRVEYRGASFDIHKKAIVVTAEDQTKVYGEEDPAYTFAAEGLADDTAVECSFSREEGQNVGSYTILPEGPAELDNYTVTYQPGTLTILPREVSVVPDPAGKTYGDEEPALTARVDGVLAQEEGLISFTLTREEGEDAGSYVITAEGTEEQGNYLVSFETATFTIDRRPVTVTALPKTKIYGDADPELEAEMEGLIDGDDDSLIAYSLEREEGENVGTRRITPSGDAEQGNYEVTFIGSSLTITPAAVTVRADEQHKTYGDEDPVWTAEVTGMKNGEDPEELLRYTIRRAEGEDAGMYLITPAGDASQGNYTVEYLNGTLTIDKAPLTVKAENAEKVYGEEDPSSYAITLQGLRNGDDESIAECAAYRASGEHAGTYVLTPVVINEDELTNYEITKETGVFTITKAPLTVTPDDKSKVYSEPDPQLTYSVSGLRNGDTEAVTDGLVLLHREEGEDAGEYRITAEASGEAADYDVTFGTGTLTILPVSEENGAADVVVRITGNHASAVYEGEEHTVSGYSVEILSPLYTENDFVFHADAASASRTEAGRSVMGLSADQFENTNPNFGKVIFDVVDGYLDITGASAVVTITGHTASYPYDGEEHGVSGYDAETDTALYTEADFRFEGDADAARTDAGQSAMGLVSGQFVNTNPNFTEVEFRVTDGYVDVTPIRAEVTITGNTDTSVYDGNGYTAAGYTFRTDTDLYTDNDFIFTGSAIAVRTDAGRTDMGLLEDQFVNTSPNFDEVTFIVEDGFQEITARDVILTSASDEKIYDGNALTNDEVTVSGDGFAEGEGASYTVSGTQTRTGSSENTFGYELDPETTKEENYRITMVNGTLTVRDREEKYTIILTPNAGEAEYDGTQHSVSGFEFTVFTFDGNEYTVAGIEAGASAADSGIYPAEVTGTPIVLDKDGNDVSDQFDLSIAPAFLQITPKTVTVTARPAEKTYGEEDSALTAEVEGLLGDDTVEYALFREEGETAGEYMITADGERLQGNYRVEYQGASFVINKKAITVTADDKTKVYGEEDPAFTFTAEGLVDQEELTCFFSREEGENTGSYTILPYGPAELDNYTVSYHAGTLTIQPREAVVIPDSAQKTYGDEDPVLTARIEGLLEGEEETLVSYTLSREEGEEAGSYVITAAGEEEQGNYVLTFDTGLFTIGRRPVTVTALPKTKVYGDPDPVMNAVIEGMVSGDAASLISYSLSREEGENVGSYAIIPAGEAEQGNYEVTFVNSSLSITTATVTVLAVEQWKTYGEEDPVLTAEVTGMKNGEDPEELLQYTITRAGGEDAGIYPVFLAGNVSQGNYTVRYEGSVLHIRPAEVLVTADDQEKTYGDPDPVLTATVTGLRNGDDESVLRYELSRQSGEDVGEYPVIASGARNQGNYIVLYENGTMEITRKAIVITADDLSRKYGEEDPALTAHIEGLAAGDSAEDLDYTLVRQEGTDAGEYEIRVSGETEQGNYSVTYESGSFTIERASVVIRAVPASKIYGEEDPLLTADIRGLVTWEDRISFSVSREEGENVGTYEITPSGETEQGNYTVTYEPAVFEIRRAPVVVRAENKSKVYGEEDPEWTAVISGMQFGEDPSLIRYEASRLEGEDAGSYPVILTGDAVQGNYTVEYENGTLTITRAPLQVRAENAGKIYGEEDPSDYVVTLEGLRNGDEESLAVCTAWRSAGEHAGDYVLTPVVINEADLGNYEISKEAGTFTISKAPLTVTAEGKTKVYSEPDPVLTATVNGLRNGDTEAVLENLYTLVREDGEAAGTYNIFAEERAKASDYEITYEPGTLTVLRVSEENGAADVVVTITGNHDSAVYDGEEHSISGYTVTISNPLYSEDDFEFLGNDAQASRTDAGRTMMGLSADQFQNTNPNFGKVIFDVADGYLDVEGARAEVIISGHTGAYAYDAEPHIVSGYDVEIDNDLYTEADFRFDGEAEASRTEAGRSVMGLVSGQFVNTNPNFTDVSFIVTDGYVDVNPVSAEVTIIGNTASAVYDGEEHSIAGYTFETDSPLYTEEDFIFTGEAEAVKSDAGREMMGLAEEQFLNRNANFSTVSFTVVDGFQEITKRQVILTSASAEKEYDGLPLTAMEVTVSGDGFAPGENAFCTVTGRQTLPGGSGNYFTYELSEGTRAGNYEIFTIPGRLTVHDRSEKYALTVEAEGGDFLYDGSVKSVTGIRNTVFEVNGRTYTVEGLTAEASRRDAGAETVSISGEPVVRDEFHRDVTAQFDITLQEGLLLVRRRHVNLVSGSGRKEYDGTALENSEITVSGDGFARGEGATYDVTGAQTLPGSSANTFAYRLNRGTDEGNYEFHTEEGILKVTDRSIRYEITIRARSEEYTYDGQEKTLSGFETLTFTVDGHTYTAAGVQAEASGTEAGTYSIKVTGKPVILDEEGQDVTRQFIIHTVDGELRILEPEPEETESTEQPAEEQLIVTIIGNHEEKTYNRTEQSVSGYMAELRVGTEPVEDPTIRILLKDGYQAEAAGIQAGRYMMGLTDDSFTVTSDRYSDILVVVTDGYLDVTPVPEEILVPVSGNRSIVSYNRSEQTVTGFEADLPDETIRISLAEGAAAAASGTMVGEYPMGLTEQSFVLTSDNYSNLRAQVTDGWLRIRPQTDLVTVEITGYSEEVSYDGEEHTISGYTAVMRDSSGEIIDDGIIISLKEGVEAQVSGTEPGEYTMGLTADSFEIQSDLYVNFDVEITDGRLVILPSEEEEPVIPIPEEPEPEPTAEPEDTEEPGPTAEPEITVQPEPTAEPEVTVQPEPAEEPEITEPEASDETDSDSGEEEEAATGLTVEKNLLSESFAKAGDILEYEILVTNGGDSPYRNIVVKDDLTGMSEAIDLLKPGAVRTFYTSYTVKEDDIERGYVENSAEADGEEILQVEETTEPEGEDTVVTPVSRQVTLIVRYIGANGQMISEPFSRAYNYGDVYTVNSPLILGYQADLDVVSGQITEDMVIDVHYVQETYSITIIYRELNGRVIQEPTVTSAVAGDEYRINAPAIPGYVSLQNMITGEMLPRDLQITLFYAEEQQTETDTIPVVSQTMAQLPDGSLLIEDYGSPLGLGNISLNEGVCIE